MTNEEKLMDLYRHKGYTDGQARAAARQMITDITREINLQLHEAQEVIKLCIDQGGLGFHDEWRKCPEDDTCVCPDVKRVNSAMKGYTEKR